jgi:hypothetical protein
MDSVQAYKTLNLHPSADGQMVADAYWRLVRVAQAEADSPEARAEVERLNDAYTTLSPKTQPRPAPQQRTPVEQVAGSGVWLLDAVADWIVAQLNLTKARWPGRTTEISIIAVATLALMFIALSTGAAITLTFVATAFIFAALWAPWRKTG